MLLVVTPRWMKVIVTLHPRALWRIGHAVLHTEYFWGTLGTQIWASEAVHVVLMGHTPLLCFMLVSSANAAT